MIALAYGGRFRQLDRGTYLPGIFLRYHHQRIAFARNDFTYMCNCNRNNNRDADKVPMGCQSNRDLCPLTPPFTAAAAVFSCRWGSAWSRAPSGRPGAAKGGRAGGDVDRAA